MMTPFDDNWRSIADTLALSETDFSVDDFQLCTAKLIEGEHFYDGDIGVVSFSKVVFDEPSTKALLYYEFMRGGNCGMGEIIEVELFNGRWRIKNASQLWIS